MTTKLCVVCRHFILDGGEQDYSELTPGHSAYIACRKAKFNYQSLDSIGEDYFRSFIRRAETCDEFVEARDEEVTP